MCGITGWIHFNENLARKSETLKAMTATLEKRGPDAFGYYITERVLLGHRRLTVVDPAGGAQPMTRKRGPYAYTIVYNGELYNTEDIRRQLSLKGYTFKSYSDTEVLLIAYIAWGAECLEYVNGIFSFAIWDGKNQIVFLARDHLGVKPLFYTEKGGHLLFASEIKALLANPMIEPVVEEEGLMGLFGLGPARGLGHGIFKDIKEVPPAHYLIFNGESSRLKQYWELEAKPHTETLDETIEHTRHLVVDAIERQLVSDVPVCTFLSGGLDSSAISAIAAKKFKERRQGPLHTFSIDYKENEKYFESNEFQPNSDGVWAERMAKSIGSHHHPIELTNEGLVDALRDVVFARDLPGMADIDSSLYLFAKEVKKHATVALSGECADEVFGGYPWYRNTSDIYADTFPWSKYVDERVKILNPALKKLPLKAYVQGHYEDTIKKVPKLGNESVLEQRMRQLFYLNIKWFMVTLLNRKDRMTMASSLEVRVPFADKRIVDYTYNIPIAMKFMEGREKGLLRQSLKGILPDVIIERKKSPYPKTHHPVYTKLVQRWMSEILQDPTSPILNLVDDKAVGEIVKTGGAAFKKPWFGQLMTGPQLIAHLIQMNIWLKYYNVKIKL